MNINRNGILHYSEDYSYENGKISKIEYYLKSTSWFDSTISLFQYPGNNEIVILNYYISNGEMIPLLKDSLEFSNALLVRRTNFIEDSGNWNTQYKFEYEYSQGLLINEIYYTPATNNWDEAYRTVYEYDGANRKSATNYQDDELQFIYWKELADYEGNKLSSVVHSKYFNGELREFEKFIFQFQGDMVSSIDYYNKQETWINNGVITYSYDEMKNTDTVVDDRTVLWPVTQKVYFFEVGPDNYNQILDPGQGIMNIWLNPHPLNAVPPPNTINYRTPMPPCFPASVHQN